MIFKSLYLAFRFAPGILVLCFLFNSLINQDAKGFIYVIGLGLTCLSAIGLSPFLRMTTGELPLVCTLLSPGNNGAFLSQFPLTTITYTFTIAYLMYYILTYYKNKKVKLRTQSFRLHFGIIMVLCGLVIVDAFWHQRMECISHDSSSMILLCAGMIGITGGILWGLIVGKVLPLTRYMMPGGTNLCWSPSPSIYRCRETNALGSLL